MSSKIIQTHNKICKKVMFLRIPDSQKQQKTAYHTGVAGEQATRKPRHDPEIYVGNLRQQITYIYVCNLLAQIPYINFWVVPGFSCRLLACHPCVIGCFLLFLTIWNT